MKIRSATTEDAAGIAKVQVESWRTTYRGIIPQRFLAEMSYAERENMWTRILDTAGTVTFVVEDDHGEVVGFANAGPERSGGYRGIEGELNAIYLLEQVQGNGVGRRLMHHVMEALISKDFSSMLVWVLADNRSGRAFYESFGPEKIDAQPIQIGGAELQELAYGWRNLKHIRKNKAAGDA